jgi:hypothetical protein
VTATPFRRTVRTPPDPIRPRRVTVAKYCQTCRSLFHGVNQCSAEWQKWRPVTSVMGWDGTPSDESIRFPRSHCVLQSCETRGVTVHPPSPNLPNMALAIAPGPSPTHMGRTVYHRHQSIGRRPLRKLPSLPKEPRIFHMRCQREMQTKRPVRGILPQSGNEIQRCHAPSPSISNSVSCSNCHDAHRVMTFTCDHLFVLLFGLGFNNAFLLFFLVRLCDNHFLLLL